MRLCDSIKEAIGNLAKDSASLIRLSVILTSFERNMQMLVQRMECIRFMEYHRDSL